jgi:hypothetical protein
VDAAGASPPRVADVVYISSISGRFAMPRVAILNVFRN